MQRFSAFFHLTIIKKKSTVSYYSNNSRGIEYESLWGDYGYKAVGYNTRHYGAWEVSYQRVLSRQFQFNLGLGCELSSKHWDLYDIPDGPRIKRIMDYRISLMPGFDYFISNHAENKLRLSGQAGVLWIHRGLEYFDNDRNRQKFAWQFWCVYDRKIIDAVWLNMGIGYGNLGIIKIGISHPF